MDRQRHLGIVIPLKSRKTSQDWALTCRLLRDTLCSVNRQDDRGFSAIVVGNEYPNACREFFGQVEFIESDRSVSVPASGSLLERQTALTKDKNTKIVTGMRRLAERSLDVSHWYALDADDLVHRSLGCQIHQLPLEYGALLTCGYQLYATTNRVRTRRGIDQICGSTSILADSMVGDLGDSFESCYATLPWCRFGHRDMRRFFTTEAGSKFKIVREKLVTYVTGHGDNASDQYHKDDPYFSSKEKWKGRLLGRPFVGRLRNAFLSDDFSTFITRATSTDSCEPPEPTLAETTAKIIDATRACKTQAIKKP